MTLERARGITHALATPVAPAPPAPQRPYSLLQFIDPNDMPTVRILEGLDALLAWAEAGGDLTVFRRKP